MNGDQGDVVAALGGWLQWAYPDICATVYAAAIAYLWGLLNPAEPPPGWNA